MTWTLIDQCPPPKPGAPAPDNPFAQRRFLHALEQTGCCNTQSGWEPAHQRHDQGALLPLYRKYHSYGEYVFDWAWADAYARAGLNYFPKLVTAIPFTPSMGPRVLDVDTAAALPAMDEWIDTLPHTCAEHDASGWHLLFPDTALLSRFAEPEFILRKGCQFHWHNRSYRTFDDFLQRMTARRRKTIRKERRRVTEAGIEIRMVEGSEMRADWLQRFYAFYHSTYLKRGMHGYLTQTFFRALVTDLADSVCFALAFRNDELIAGALFFHDQQTLYGRYWGCIEEIDCLHFEVCYYQGIEYAITKGLQRFDPGTQGEHKVPRGFEPVATWSAHWLAHREFHELVRRHVRQERAHIDAYMAEAETLLPFKAQDS
ncbi:GNAT family N-acetyltransferase [Natronospirillum operosum]|nr:GNAT family N-acetyltransferase [Natronospirillum operosum]